MSKAKTRFSLPAALNYAAEHVSGCNPGAGLDLASNVEGAARLCAWALARSVLGNGTRVPQAAPFRALRNVYPSALVSTTDDAWHSPIAALKPQRVAPRRP